MEHGSQASLPERRRQKKKRGPLALAGPWNVGTCPRNMAAGRYWRIAPRTAGRNAARFGPMLAHPRARQSRQADCASQSRRIGTVSGSTQRSSVGSSSVPLASTGVVGLDDILGGGLPSNRLYLLDGSPGTGKTTLALQFLL